MNYTCHNCCNRVHVANQAFALNPGNTHCGGSYNHATSRDSVKPEVTQHLPNLSGEENIPSQKTGVLTSSGQVSNTLRSMSAPCWPKEKNKTVRAGDRKPAAGGADEVWLRLLPAAAFPARVPAPARAQAALNGLSGSRAEAQSPRLPGGREASLQCPSPARGDVNAQTGPPRSEPTLLPPGPPAPLSFPLSCGRAGRRLPPRPGLTALLPAPPRPRPGADPLGHFAEGVAEGHVLRAVYVDRPRHRGHGGRHSRDRHPQRRRPGARQDRHVRPRGVPGAVGPPRHAPSRSPAT